ncbi:hypothetical protein L226DRAFT_37596 [Lentinus tigrinus ALCF2SS1-7]|uniref:uncharacterized protein n=1 Tax=Lentinus tigrinus ALCF2SS1-7 TaxID=1328758 RepID=UPI001165EBF2|nr:hypothetical protein L226DRAFT_37596 [Lentinus tigrinus ALCF2SS1-7]
MVRSSLDARRLGVCQAAATRSDAVPTMIQDSYGQADDLPLVVYRRKACRCGKKQQDLRRRREANEVSTSMPVTGLVCTGQSLLIGCSYYRRSKS